MGTAAVLEQLKKLGVGVEVDGGDIYLEPFSAVPAPLLAQVREHKAAIIERLLQQSAAALKHRHPLAFPGEGPGGRELAELERRVKAEGYVLCWSELLQDFLAVHADDVDPSTILPGFVPYGDTELRHLFGDDKPPDKSGLLRIHAAKKTGARVTGNRPHRQRRPETP